MKNYVDQSVLTRIAYDELFRKMLLLKITNMHDERVKSEYDEAKAADEELMKLLHGEVI